MEQNLSQDVGSPITIHATVLSASQVDLNQSTLSQESMLEQAFRQDVQALSARVVDLSVTKTASGYKLETALALLENSQLDVTALDQIQLKLSQLVGEPVVIQAVFLSGTPVEVGGTASPTPAPFATPTRFPTLKPTGTP